MIADPPTLLTISQVSRTWPDSLCAVHRVSPSTVARWIVSGCPGRDGTRVRLRATRVGSRWMVAPADLEAFLPPWVDSHDHHILIGTPAHPRPESGPVMQPACKQARWATDVKRASLMGLARRISHPTRRVEIPMRIDSTIESANDKLNIREAARTLFGWDVSVVCRPDPKEKRPTQPGWSTRSLWLGDFREGDQIGIIGDDFPTAAARGTP